MNSDATLDDRWTKRRLRFDMRMNPLKSKLDLHPDTNVSFVPMEAVGEFGELDATETRSLAGVYDGYTYFAEGDVCIAKITPCFENGKGAVAEGLTNGIGFGTTELHVARPLSTLDARFFYYISVSQEFRSLGESEMLGAGGQKRVPEDFVKDWRASLPSVKIQRSIAEFLDGKAARIDALIAKKRALLDRLAEKQQALITRAVIRGINPTAPLRPSGIDWFGDVPTHWNIIPFKWRCRIQSGQVDPTDRNFASMPLVAPDHIEAKSGRLLDVSSAAEQGAISGKYFCPQGAVLYTKIRPALRKVALFEGECLCSADMYAIDPGPEINRHFLYFFLLTDAFSSYAELESLRVAMPKINRDALGAFPVPVPPLDEQRTIAEYCMGEEMKHRTCFDQVARSIERLKEYRVALITAFVAGTLRLANESDRLLEDA